MKRVKAITLAGLAICMLNFNAGSQTLSSVISETISFLQGKTVQVNTVKNAVIEFSIVDNLNDFGIISGRAVLVVDSAFQAIGTKSIKKFFLRSGTGQWINTNGTATNKTFTFITPFLLTAPSTLTVSSSKGTGNNSLRYDLVAVKTINSSLSGANEYIISGFLDSANPKKFITIRIIQQVIPFG